jgi:hypothetical protein
LVEEALDQQVLPRAWRSLHKEGAPSQREFLGLCIDISATPFTNTLPIRRLGLKPGESEQLAVTYVRVPELLVGPEWQRYGCLEARAEGGLYRFEALPAGFTAELPVDAEGLVIDYPGLFRRVWSG